MAEPKTRLELIASTVQVLSVVVGVVISVFSFNLTRQKEADARRFEAEKPLAELRRTIYLETAKTAAIIANPVDRPASDVAVAKRRFRELYVSELSMVETPDVAAKMVDLAGAVDPELRSLTPAQSAALALAHALKESYNNGPAGK